MEEKVIADGQNDQTDVQVNTQASVSETIPHGDLSRFEQEQIAYEGQKIAYNALVQNLKATLKNAKKQLRSINFRRCIEGGFCLFVCLVLVAGSFTATLFLSGDLENDYQTSYKELTSSAEAQIKSVTQQISDALYQENLSVLRQQQEKVNKLETFGDANNSAPAPIVFSLQDTKDADIFVSSLKRQQDKTAQLFQKDDVNYYKVISKLDLDKYLVTDSGTDTIFPGAIVRGDSLFTGNGYALISNDRVPMTLTSNQLGSSSKVVENIGVSSVSKALQSFQPDDGDQSAKEWSYDMKTVTNSQQLRLALGIKALPIGGEVGVSLSDSETTVAVVFSQLYYSVNVQPLSSPAKYFQPDMDYRALGDYEPAYISSVDYGRMVIMLVSAEMSEKNLSAKLQAMIQGVGISAGVEAVSQDKSLSYQLFQYGGNTNDINMAITEDSRDKGLFDVVDKWINGGEKDSNAVSKLNQFINDNDTLINPVPISYKLKYLSDNAPVPPMIIEKETLLLANNLKKVTLTLSGNQNGVFHMEVPEIAGALLTGGDMTITDKGVASGEVTLLWNSDCKLPLLATFNNGSVQIDLSDCPAQGVKTLPLSKKLWKNTNLHVQISEFTERSA